MVTDNSNQPTDNNECIYLGVQLLGAKLVLPISDVVYLTPTIECTPLPLVKPWVKGVTHWQGKILTVINLNEMIGGRAYRTLQDSQIIVEFEDNHYGLIFEAIHEKLYIQQHLWIPSIEPTCPPLLHFFTDSHVMIDDAPCHLFDYKQLFTYDKLANIAL